MRLAAARMLGALVIGVATLFVLKPDPRTHWSIPPGKVIVVTFERLHPSLRFDRVLLLDPDFL